MCTSRKQIRTLIENLWYFRCKYTNLGLGLCPCLGHDHHHVDLCLLQSSNCSLRLPWPWTAAIRPIVRETFPSGAHLLLLPLAATAQSPTTLWSHGHRPVPS